MAALDMAQRAHCTATEALDTLLNLTSRLPVNEIAVSSRSYTLLIMKNYLDRLEIDPTPLSVIHVAGTKGKGSTCAFVERILRQKGFKTGLFTSPHLINVCERFRINGIPVEEGTFLEHFWAVWDGLHETVALSGEFPPIAGFFRFLTLVAFRIFLQEKVDVVILEVGIGGRLDATNVIDKPVVCGVTTLDLDHTNVLGNTLNLIAREKAGIFKENVPAFTIVQEESAAIGLSDVANQVNAPLIVLPSLSTFFETNGQYSSISLGLEGSYQETNAALAVALVNTWLKKTQPLGNHQRSYLDIDEDIVHGLATCQWPGRSQTFHCPPYGATFYLDGAHTPLSMECCVNWFKEASKKSPETKHHKILIFHCSHERAILPIFQPLHQEHFDYVILCPVDSGRPTVIQPPLASEIFQRNGIAYDQGSLEKEEETFKNHSLQWQYTLKHVWDQMHHVHQTTTTPCASMVVPSIKESLEFLKELTRKSDRPSNVLVTGSLHLVGGMLHASGWKH